MAAQRIVACPACDAPRVTKATGRQVLTCTACGRPGLVRDWKSSGVGSAPAGPRLAPPAPPAQVSPALAGLGGVEVLPPAQLRIGPVAPAAPLAETDPGNTERSASDAAFAEAANTPESENIPAPGPVSVGPGRRVGYYARVTGRG